MKKILVSDGDYEHTLGIIRALSKEGFLVDCIGNKICISRFSRYLNKLAFDQSKFNKQYIGFFLELLLTENYDYFIPIGAESVFLTNHFRDEINKYVKIVIAPKESINICLNKERLLNRAKSINIKIPTTYRYDSYKEFKTNLKDIIFPVITKSREEISKQEVKYFNDSKDLDKFMRSNKFIKDTLIQQKITGSGIGFFAYYKEGVLKKYFIHKRIRELPIEGGSSSFAKSYFDKRAYIYGKKLLDHLNWNGIAMVEFKNNQLDKNLYLMEVNPKFWGSHDLSISSGINFAGELIRQDLNSTNNMKIDYRLNTKFQWPTKDFKTSIYKPIITFKVIKDFLNPNIHNNFWISDLKPTLYLIFFPLFGKILKFLKVSKMLSRVIKYGFFNTLVKTFTEISGLPIPQYCFIDKEISVGMQPSLIGKMILKITNHKTILNLRSEFDYDNSIFNPELYKNIKLIEFHPPTLKQLDKGADFINKSLLKGKGKIYIHCREGISRAPLIACAYLIKYKKFSVEEAIKHISKKRKYINILPNQLEKLKLFFELNL